MPNQEAKNSSIHIPKGIESWIPIVPTCFELVSNEQFDVYHTFFDKNNGLPHMASIHLNNGKEVPVQRSERQTSTLTNRHLLFLQDEKVTREIIPVSLLSILGGKLQTSSEATEYQQKQCSCGKKGSKKCSRCHKQYYCNETCQKADWSKHQLVCIIVE